MIFLTSFLLVLASLGIATSFSTFSITRGIKPFLRYQKQPPHTTTNVLLLQATITNEVQVEFQPANVFITAKVGDPLSIVAEKANVPINYKCKKGECGTCQVFVQGKWIKTCQTTIPPTTPGTNYAVTVKPFKEKAKFFSPQSFLDGVINNGLGVVGFITESAKVDGEFNERMEREKKIQEKIEEKKRLNK